MVEEFLGEDWEYMTYASGRFFTASCEFSEYIVMGDLPWAREQYNIMLDEVKKEYELRNGIGSW